MFFLVFDFFGFRTKGTCFRTNNGFYMLTKVISRQRLCMENSSLGFLRHFDRCGDTTCPTKNRRALDSAILC